MFGLISSLALATELVLHPGDPHVAIQRVAEDTGRPAWELRPIELHELLVGDAPRVVGADQPPGCTAGPTTVDGLRAAVDLAVRQVDAQKDAAAAAGLTAALAGLVCLTDPAEASLVARGWFLQGLLLDRAGEPDAARAAFQRAHEFKPGLRWDDRYTPTALPRFEAAASAVRDADKGTLALGPGFEAVRSLWVDGQHVPVVDGAVSLSGGIHLVQVLEPVVSTFEVAIRKEGALVLLSPPLLSARMLEHLDDPATRRVLDAIQQSRSGPDALGWAWSGTRTWKLGPAWEELPSVWSAERDRRHATGHTLSAVGLTAAGVGAVGAAAGWARFADLAGREALDDDSPLYAERHAWGVDASVLGGVSTGLLVAGGATALVGFLLAAEGPPPVSVTPLAGGASVTVTLLR